MILRRRCSFENRKVTRMTEVFSTQNLKFDGLIFGPKMALQRAVCRLKGVPSNADRVRGLMYIRARRERFGAVKNTKILKRGLIVNSVQPDRVSLAPILPMRRVTMFYNAYTLPD